MILKTNSLIPDIVKIVRDKGTEFPFTGRYDDFLEAGSYLCRVCGLALYRSLTKFSSGCGWPSFDDDIQGAVKRQQDADGFREEIVCARCEAHLGHVFLGERYTQKNTRHCVNAASLDFVHDLQIIDSEEIILAAGCFWGVESVFKQLPGVVFTEVGYTGGTKTHPSYEQVCTGTTGHVEAVRIIFDPTQINFTDVIRFFFTMHDATQKNGQGLDVGSQYLSAAFYYTDEQKEILQTIIKELQSKGSDIATSINAVTTFWPAEEYHQNYFEKHNQAQSCHSYSS